MKTTKPIATISFNTLAYLCLRLQELRKARKVSFWALIPHKGEDDESGKKPHIHLYIEPAVSVQTDDLCEFMVEPVPGEKPFRCLPFRSSKFDDWYLYSLHAVDYLQAKGLQKVYRYTDSDFISSDDDYLRSLVYRIDWLQIAPARAVRDAVNSGISKSAFLMSGRVPVTQTSAYMALYDAARQLQREQDEFEHQKRVQSMVDEFNLRHPSAAVGVDENGEINP